MPYTKKSSTSSGHYWPTNKNDGRRTRRVLVPIANGTEEIELTCITDVLSRFGAEVVVAAVEDVGGGTATVDDGRSGAGAGGGGRRGRHSCGSSGGGVDTNLICRMSRGLKVVADTTIQSAAEQEWDLIALPGGIKGSRTLRSSEHLMSLLRRHGKAKRLTGAICAAPAIVLASAPGLLGSGGGATCYPAKVLRTSIPNASDDDIVVQKNIVTSQGPGTALKFALQLGEELFGKDKANTVAKKLLVDRHGRFEEAAPASAEPRSPFPGGLEDLDDEVSGEGMETSVFMEILWPTLDRFGWTMEKGSKRGDVNYCQPGVKRKKGGIADDASKGIHFFTNRRDLRRCLAKEWTWNTDVQEALEIYSACLERMADLVAMGKVSPDDCTVASLTAEVAKNANVAEVPLFDGIVLPQLEGLGWVVERETRLRKKTYYPTSYVSRDSKKLVEAVDYFVSRQQVLDFLCRDDTWSSMDEVLRCRDVYQACISVGNELQREGKLEKKYSIQWLVEKAREKRPYLPVIPITDDAEWQAQKGEGEEDKGRSVHPPASAVTPNLTQASSPSSSSSQSLSPSLSESGGSPNGRFAVAASLQEQDACDGSKPAKLLGGEGNDKEIFDPTDRQEEESHDSNAVVEPDDGGAADKKPCPAAVSQKDADCTRALTLPVESRSDKTKDPFIHRQDVNGSTAAEVPDEGSTTGQIMGSAVSLEDTDGSKALKGCSAETTRDPSNSQGGSMADKFSDGGSIADKLGDPFTHREDVNGSTAAEVPDEGSATGQIMGLAVCREDTDGSKALKGCIAETTRDPSNSQDGSKADKLSDGGSIADKLGDPLTHREDVNGSTAAEVPDEGSATSQIMGSAVCREDTDGSKALKGCSAETTRDPSNSQDGSKADKFSDGGKLEDLPAHKEDTGRNKVGLMVSALTSPGGGKANQIVKDINNLLDEDLDQEEEETAPSSVHTPSTGKRKRGNPTSAGVSPKLLHKDNAPEIGPGWTLEIKERQNGKMKGCQDKYWYSPVANKKFRSMKEIGQFKKVLEGLGGFGDDDEKKEEEAWKIFKKR